MKLKSFNTNTSASKPQISCHHLIKKDTREVAWSFKLATELKGKVVEINSYLFLSGLKLAETNR